jgi:hypothetical protein
MSGIEQENTLEWALCYKLEVRLSRDSDQKKVLDMPADELKLFKDLFTRILDYTPRNRLSAERVVNHELLKA